jgi:hypothetical protein
MIRRSVDYWQTIAENRVIVTDGLLSVQCLSFSFHCGGSSTGGSIYLMVEIDDCLGANKAGAFGNVKILTQVVYGLWGDR